MFRIADILDAISKVQSYTESINFDTFTADRKTVDAVIRNLIIIGEAASHIPDDICEANADIPWKDMKAMRNFVVREYFGVSDNVLRETVQVDLPPLVSLLKSLMEKQGTET